MAPTQVADGPPQSQSSSGEAYDLDSDDLLAVEIGLVAPATGIPCSGWPQNASPKYLDEAYGYFENEDR